MPATRPGRGCPLHEPARKADTAKVLATERQTAPAMIARPYAPEPPRLLGHLMAPDERRSARPETPAMARYDSRKANLAAKNRKTVLALEKANKARAKDVKPSAEKRRT